MKPTDPASLSSRRAHLKQFFALGTLLYLQFFLLYGSSNYYLASNEIAHYHFYFDWELHIPLIAPFIYIYLSLSLFLILPVFYLRYKQLPAWALSYMWMTFIACSLFIIFPTELAGTRPTIISGSTLTQASFSLLYFFDKPHNLFPSLHIAYTTLALLIILNSDFNRRWQGTIIFWWLLLLISILFVHQHYMLDILGGLVLATGCFYCIYLSKNKI